MYKLLPETVHVPNKYNILFLLFLKRKTMQVMRPIIARTITIIVIPVYTMTGMKSDELISILSHGGHVDALGLGV